jgi:hypothetical protein
MQDAAYLRSQAELCLRVAQHIRDETLAGKFRAAATRYFLRAEAEPVRGEMYANRSESSQPVED